MEEIRVIIDVGPNLRDLIETAVHEGDGDEINNILSTLKGVFIAAILKDKKEIDI